MVVVERRQRKGPVLTPSSLPCLGAVPTINITEGCAHGCAYCYTQGYSGYPGADHVVLFDNTADLVRAELSRKRRRPRRVYFSPSSDAFQPVPEVLDVTFDTMSALLDRGVEVAFLTKGAVGDRFLTLFAALPDRVFAQIGITTQAESLIRALEPRAASVAERLRTIEGLTQTGVVTRARLDPLVPDLTDIEENLGPLLSALSRRGIRSVSASYLFLRPAFARSVAERLRALAGWSHATEHWPWCRFADGVGGGRMIGPGPRRERLGRLRDLAAEQDIDVHVCACKNTDIDFASNCRIAGPPLPPLRHDTAPLFDGHP